MQASQIKLKRESDRELLFAHYPLSGLVIAALGIGIGYSPTYMGADSTTRWIFGVGGGIFAIAGILAAFWRYELLLDLVSRTYTRRKGFWPSPKKTKGSLDELNSVILTQHWTRSRGSRIEHPWWKISLSFNGWEEPVSIEALGNERKGHESLEYYAKKLKTWAVDQTSDQEKREKWDELDLPLADRSADQLSKESGGLTVDPSMSPPESTIQVTGYPGNHKILLPPLGFNAGLVFLALFGLAFAAFGGFFVLAQSGLYTELTGKTISMTESSPGVGWIVSSAFVLVGLAAAFLGLGASYGREQIHEMGGEIIYDILFLGRSLRTKRISKREIEEIDLRGDISPRHRNRTSVTMGNVRIGTRRSNPPTRSTALFIRSDKQIVRFGRKLSDSDKQWLLGAVRQMVKSGS